ncbi:MAG: hypothetical protein HOP18_23110, partial [Deltaproteobacteria bacterium]|nr:hypothetical protein [Deltaproteobacteria bacterium]
MSAKESSQIPRSLLDWPYATRQLLQTPDPEVIEAHARNLLSRALNVGRLTAFVGSGASMAYGRISWIDMLCAAQEAVLERYDAKSKKGELTGSHIVRLAALLKTHEIKKDRKYDASAQLTVFQLSEELDKAIDAEDRLRGERPTKTFRDTIMWVTRDERGHTERLLSDAFLDRDAESESIDFEDFLRTNSDSFTEFLSYKKPADDVEGVENKLIGQLVQRTLWGKSELPFKDRSLPQFPTKKVKQRKVHEDLENELTKIANLGKSQAESIVFDFEKFISSPVDRYRLAAQFRELPEKNRFQALAVIARNIDKLRDAEKQNRERKHSVRGDRLSRKNFHQRDPLLLLHRELSIRRFLTTNYDHEIGRLLKDIGYHRIQKGDKENAAKGLDAGDPIAPMYKEILFDHESTGELAALATSDRSRRRANWVVHLHGRAEEEGGSIIVTEEDYQRHYARNDEHRASMDDAVKLAFAAQPILFVGIGMDEVDLLRPLREFMSETTRLGDRLVVALLPADGEAKEESARKILLLRRYGVYTIHFGEASVSSSAEEKKSGRWLALIKKVKNSAEEILKLFDKAAGEKQRADFLNRRDQIREKSKKFSDGFKRTEWSLDEKDHPFFDEKDRLFFDTKANQITVRVPDAVETILARDLELEEEIDAFNEVLRFICQLHDSSDSKEEWFQFRRDAQSYRAMLAGTYNIIQTVCLCATLKRLAQSWKEWRNDWRTLPSP